MELLYADRAIAVAVKPAGVLSTDEPGGMPSLVRAALGDPQAEVRTVHRLDRVVGGLMVLARSAEAAAELSRQIRAQTFEKRYLAILHGTPEAPEGMLRDLLLRDRRTCKTLVVQQPGKYVQEAILTYRVLQTCGTYSRVEIHLQTGRTHQIRAQFSAHGHPLVGDRKYGYPEDGCETALWSAHLAFCHPESGERLSFTRLPPACGPWTLV